MHVPNTQVVLRNNFSAIYCQFHLQIRKILPRTRSRLHVMDLFVYVVIYFLCIQQNKEISSLPSFLLVVRVGSTVKRFFLKKDFLQINTNCYNYYKGRFETRNTETHSKTLLVCVSTCFSNVLGNISERFKVLFPELYIDALHHT
eukprot:TRINITY_DN37458_c0_g1_i1.p1 TRINITY_DN37458_c0_g1~~TRINITY_DN37458_c0_g1_i1.p1  ORF type:complete len:145 (+),score=1.74 TRINITY_DN37458_c0_g1_i1:726-1160(+)